MSPEIAVATKVLEGIIDAVDRPEGKSPSLTLNGQKWYMESQARFQRNWVEPRKGMTVRVEVDPWTKNDGTIGWTVKQIEDISEFTEEEVNGATVSNNVAYLQGSATKRGEFRTPSQIMRTSALESAVNVVIASSQPQQNANALSATVLAQAAVFFEWIESGLE
jgi:hypothetical protein